LKRKTRIILTKDPIIDLRKTSISSNCTRPHTRITHRKSTRKETNEEKLTTEPTQPVQLRGGGTNDEECLFFVPSDDDDGRKETEKKNDNNKHMVEENTTRKVITVLTIETNVRSK
jgi:hypothetical protein